MCSLTSKSLPMICLLSVCVVILTQVTTTTTSVPPSTIAIRSPRAVLNDEVGLARNKLLSWFLGLRKNGTQTRKWGHQLPRIAVALFLGDPVAFVSGNRTTMNEMNDELDIQLLSKILGGGHLKRRDLSLYIHALMVACVDPRNFHGRDLVEELRSDIESNNGTTVSPFELLVLCNAGDVMSDRDILRIETIFHSQHRPFWTDNQAMATMALACASAQPGVTVDERTLLDMAQELKKRQFRNGTVDNLKTTALVVQALIATQSLEINFDLGAAVRALLAAQSCDGSVGSFLDSYYVLPVLSNSSLLQITADHCKKPKTGNPPVIKTFPQDQTVADGGNAVFVCTAVGNPPPQIEWRKNGKLVKRYATIDMPNGSVLRIEPVRAGRDDTTYECVAENGVGEPARALADLVVLPEDNLPGGFPRLIRQPNMKGTEIGRGVLLPCQAEGDPEPIIRWFKNMIPLDMTIPRYSLVQGYSLQISDTIEEDQGNYECIAENIHGSAMSVMATLFVRVRRVPPYFSIRPENLYEVMPGSSLNITCAAVGSPMPFVKWRKGLVDMDPDHTIPIGRNDLVLTNISESANYTCIVASKLGILAQVVVRTTAQVVVKEFGPMYKPQSSQGSRVSVTYSVLIGMDVDLKRTWTLKVPVNSSLYNLMETVWELDTSQKVEYNVIDGKPYVSSLMGIQDDVETGLYWFTYLKKHNAEESTLVEDSPVDVKIEANQELILWYKSGQ